MKVFLIFVVEVTKILVVEVEKDGFCCCIYQGRLKAKVGC